MPYEVKEIRGSKKPFKIINKVSGEVVGESDTMEKAQRSVGYRNAGEEKKNRPTGPSNSRTY